MPLLWRYLLRNYLRVFALCTAGFIAVLLVTRFQSIARFAATGASILYVLKFIIYQIPFILPLAVPISCLISALILFQRMSRSHELTALRACGLGLTPIAFPLLVCGALVSMLNFTIISEVGPRCRGLSKGLAYEIAALNPLCLLQKDTLIKLKNTYVDMKVLKSGKYAEDVCFIMRNISNQRLGLMLAKKLYLEDQKITGNDVTFISSIDPKNEDCFDHLIIENQSEMQTQAGDLAQYLRSSQWNVGYDALNLKILRAKYLAEKDHERALPEIARRLSLGLAAFLFTLVGVAFGMETTQARKYQGTLWAIGLMAFYLITFVAAKSMKHDWVYSIAFYLGPLPIICALALRNFKKLARGNL
ncbi:MAG: LptF/LptG family permease [Simkaniaceae bacterium]|nr:LptF/LptG family permease [Candidatus Sacchlamyda saccharinae]